MGDVLNADELLNVNDKLTSNNGKVTLVMQDDGNLVLYRQDNGKALWASHTQRKPVNRAIMQGDGNFVCYNAVGHAYWATGTWDHPGSHIVLQDDGNLVVYQDQTPLWASNTVQDWGNPGHPGDADSGDAHVGTGNWMHSWASFNPTSGVISGKTRTWCTVALRGFTGSVVPILLDQGGMPIWPNTVPDAKHQYGVDGSAIPFKTHDRTDNWWNQVPSDVAQRAAKLEFLHFYDPKNRLLVDLEIAKKTIEDIRQFIQTVYAFAAVISG
jgi:hypothetical protein